MWFNSNQPEGKLNFKLTKILLENMQEGVIWFKWFRFLVKRAPMCMPTKILLASEDSDF